MKFNNNPLCLKTGQIELSFGTVTVKALPYGFDARFSEIWPEPTPPRSVVGGKNANSTPNYDSPEYKNKVADRNQCLMAYRFYKSVEDDESLSFETPTPTSEEQLRALKNEIQNSSVSTGDVLKVINASAYLSDLIDDDNGEIGKLFV